MTTSKELPELTRQDMLAVLALGLMVAVSYFPALSGGFIWDDKIFAQNRAIREVAGLWNIWFSPGDLKNEHHYWPIIYTTFWLEHKLWGLAPLGSHLVNVALHLINSVLVWRVLRGLAVPWAWVAAALFAVHPVHVESVAWIIERKDVLSGLFYLTAVLTWVRFVETPRWASYVLALLLFVAGLLSKSIVVTLPVALLIVPWWKQGRVTATDLLRLAPFFVVALCITLADLWFYYTARTALSLGYSLIERVLIAARALCFYVGKLFWPTDLAAIYPLWDIRVSDPLAWTYVVAVAALAALLWLGRHRVGRGPLAGVLFFAVTLSPVLGFLDYGYMLLSFVADRYQYLAAAGVMAVAAAAAAHGARRLPDRWKTGAQGLVGVVLVLLGTMTWHQAGIYRDEITFFGHVLSLNPQQPYAHRRVSIGLSQTGRLEERPCCRPLCRGATPGFRRRAWRPGLCAHETQAVRRGREELASGAGDRSARQVRPPDHGRGLEVTGAVRSSAGMVPCGARGRPRLCSGPCRHGRCPGPPPSVRQGRRVPEGGCFATALRAHNGRRAFCSGPGTAGVGQGRGGGGALRTRPAIRPA